ncbi:MAG: acyl-CoA carboxylase subunit beta, partial [Acidimicrobiales bacterium]
MKRTLLAPPLGSEIDCDSDGFTRNRADILEQIAELDRLLDEAGLGGGERAMDRLRARNKMPIRDRIQNVLDPDTPFLEISPTAGYD